MGLGRPTPRAETRLRQALAGNLYWFVRGLTVEAADLFWRGVVHGHLVPAFRPEVVRALEEHQKQGDLLMIVSAAPSALVQEVGRSLGVSLAAGTDAGLEGGRHTGGRLGEVCTDAQKVVRARRLLNDHGVAVDLSVSWAYADSVTDLPLLESVGHPVAVYPDRSLRQVARQKGWAIIGGRVREGGDRRK